MANFLTQIGFGSAVWTKFQTTLFASILIFGLAAKLIRIDTPDSYCYDEVYHGFTAEEFLKQNRSTYDPWANPPKGFAYEWTHPPLGKLLIAAPMALFGANKTTMRLSSVMAGTAATLLTYSLSFVLFGSASLSLLAMGLMNIEGLNFAMSRIALIDEHLSAFVLLSALFLALYLSSSPSQKRKRYLLFSGFAAGLAIATKWSALYWVGLTWALFAISWACDTFLLGKMKDGRWPLDFRLLSFAFLSFVVIPVLTYLAVHIHYFSFGYTWANFIELQKQMWYYHSGLKQGHPSASLPWQWLFNLKPVWFYTAWPSDTTAANIYNIGNSVILWSGLVAVARASARFLADVGKWKLAFLLAAYFAFWVPWIFSPRIMFFYHYLPALPFLCILLAEMLDQFLRSPKKSSRRTAQAILVGALLWFIYFYPMETAIPLKRAWISSGWLWLPF